MLLALTLQAQFHVHISMCQCMVTEYMYGQLEVDCQFPSNFSQLLIGYEHSYMELWDALTWKPRSIFEPLKVREPQRSNKLIKFSQRQLIIPPLPSCLSSSGGWRPALHLLAFQWPAVCHQPPGRHPSLLECGGHHQTIHDEETAWYVQVQVLPSHSDTSNVSLCHILRSVL